MNVAEVLVVHADRLETGEVVWSKHHPTRPGEACVGYVRDNARVLHSVFALWSDDLAFWEAGERALAEEAKARRSTTFVLWNLTRCRDAGDAAGFCRAAAARWVAAAAELGPVS